MSQLIFDLQKMVIFYLDITDYTKQERKELLINNFDIPKDKFFNVIEEWYHKHSTIVQPKKYNRITTYGPGSYYNEQIDYNNYTIKTYVNNKHIYTADYWKEQWTFYVNLNIVPSKDDFLDTF